MIRHKFVDSLLAPFDALLKGVDVVQEEDKKNLTPLVLFKIVTALMVMLFSDLGNSYLNNLHRAIKSFKCFQKAKETATQVGSRPISF